MQAVIARRRGPSAVDELADALRRDVHERADVTHGVAPVAEDPHGLAMSGGRLVAQPVSLPAPGPGEVAGRHEIGGQERLDLELHLALGQAGECATASRISSAAWSSRRT